MMLDSTTSQGLHLNKQAKHSRRLMAVKPAIVLGVWYRTACSHLVDGLMREVWDGERGLAMNIGKLGTRQS